MPTSHTTPIAEYDYILPETAIAKYPLADRDLSKLLIYSNGDIREDKFLHLTDYLPSNSYLFFNNTKVFQARLLFKKESGSTIELFLLEPAFGIPIEQALSATQTICWKTYIGNHKKWRDEYLHKKEGLKGEDTDLRVKKIGAEEDTWVVEFSWDTQITFSELIEEMGDIPLPPYLKRKAEKKDKNSYQTIYALSEGSVAAPTAGLHFTERLFDSLQEKGILWDFVTLHVGAGTFKPIRSDYAENHRMHSEKIYFSLRTIHNILSSLETRKIIAVGTTSVRCLESLYWHGIQWLNNESSLENIELSQDYPYNYDQAIPEAKHVLRAVYNAMCENKIEVLSGYTSLMIKPSYYFHLTEGIITNFHQPRSSLLLLVSAFTQGNWKHIYSYALENDFRFLSYGDSCLLLPNS